MWSEAGDLAHEPDLRGEWAAEIAEKSLYEEKTSAVWSEATKTKDRSSHQPPCRELFCSAVDVSCDRLIRLNK